MAAAYFNQLIEPAPDMALVAVARTVEELRQLLGQQPSVLVTETQLHGEPVAPLLAELLPGGTAPRVLVLSLDDSAASVLSAVRAGVCCYWLKEHAAGRLPDVIRRCAAGQAVLNDRLIDVVLAGYRQLARAQPAVEPPTGGPVLSGRALEVLELMAAGLRNRDIGQRLGLSEHTIKIYVGQLLAYFGVSDRTAAVMRGISHGLVKAPGSDRQA